MDLAIETIEAVSSFEGINTPQNATHVAALHVTSSTIHDLNGRQTNTHCNISPQD
jgi:hypothetical protein